MIRTKLIVQRLDGGRMPIRAHVTDSGVDLFVAERIEVPPGGTVRVRTGVCMRVVPIRYDGSDVPDGELAGLGYNRPGGWTYDIRILDKSSLGSKGLKTAAGVIDNGFTGECEVVIMNVVGVGQVIRNMLEGLIMDFQRAGVLYLEPGTKIAQAVVQRVELPLILEGEVVPEAGSRGGQGWGSTGDSQ